MISADSSLLEKLNRLIDDRLDDPSLTIRSICRTLGVSRSQLHRTVKEQADTSTSRYIRQRRLERARELLIGTDMRISEICDAVGISNPQNFSKYFTEEFRVSPTQFRKDYAESADAAPDATSKTSEAVATQPNGFLPPEPPDTPKRPAARSSSLRRRNWLYAGIAAALLLVAGWGGYRWFQGQSGGRAPKTSANTLAVLPFDNLGDADGDPGVVKVSKE